MNRQKSVGFTLLETMITVAIIGIIAALAVPSYQSMIERNRLKQAVESLKSDLQFARTEAIKRSQTVLITRTPGNAGTWCYGLSVKNACSCAQATTTPTNYCEIKRILGADFSTAVNMDVPSDSVNNGTFGFRRGTIGPNGVTFSTVHYAARVVFSTVGRVRICSPSTTANPMPTGKVGLPDNEPCTD